MTRNWVELGIEWKTETVSRQMGEHRSDRVAFRHPAQIPIPSDLTKIRGWAGDDRVCAWMNAQGWRVPAQDVNRAYLEECAEGKVYNEEELRERVYNRLAGVRNSGGGGTRTITVVKRPLPDGTMYNGTDEVEYRQMYVAGLVDKGVPTPVATMIAQGLAW